MAESTHASSSEQSATLDEPAMADATPAIEAAERHNAFTEDLGVTATTPVVERDGLPKRRLLKFRKAEASGVVRPVEAGRAAAAAPQFVDNGGPILSTIHVQLIFWGRAWAGNPSPSANAITNAAASILNGPYTSALHQYRGIGRGSLRGTTLVTTSDPPSPFSDTDVINLITNLLEDGTVPEPDQDAQILYMVVMPVGTSSSGSFIGEHSFFDFTDRDLPFGIETNRAHYGWVTNDGSLAGVTSILSHELVESCTDPEGSAILGTPGTCNQSGWCEIGDVCNITGVVDGVTVQSYWSQVDGQCIVPNGPRLTNKVILGETAVGAPALSVFNPTNLLIAWTGTDAHRLLNVARSSNGTAFGGKVTLNENSIDGPGLACGAGRAFLAWTGTDPGHHLNVISSGDLQHFGNKVTLNETSPFGPALAFGNGRLYLAWTGTDQPHHLNVMSSTDGIHFGNKVTLGETSNAGPALAFLDGTLNLLWTGTDANHSLNILQSSDGTHFGNKVTLGESSDAHPALARRGDLFLCWTGRDAAHRLNVLASRTDDRHFAGKLIDGNTSVAGLTVADFHGILRIAWTGTDPAHHLNVAMLS